MSLRAVVKERRRLALLSYDYNMATTGMLEFQSIERDKGSCEKLVFGKTAWTAYILYGMYFRIKLCIPVPSIKQDVLSKFSEVQEKSTDLP